MRSPPEAQIVKALRSARNNARRKGKNFDLDEASLIELWRLQRGRCALSGLPFHEESIAGAFVSRPFAVSIDRIDSARSYTIDNVQLVCTAVNFARGQWGDDVLRQIAYGIVDSEKQQERQWFATRRAQLKAEQDVLEGVDGPDRERLKRRIAGLKSALTKGPSRLRRAGRRAKAQRTKKN